jgi:hypothetical protein
MMRETHPKVTVFVEIPVLVEQVGLEHETQRPVNGNGVEEHTEGVRQHIEAVYVEIVAHIVGKTGTDKHHRIGFADVEWILRGGNCRSELHILLFGYQ